MRTRVALLFLGLLLASTPLMAQLPDYVMLGLTPLDGAIAITSPHIEYAGIPFALDYDGEGQLMWEFCFGVYCPDVIEPESPDRELPISRIATLDLAVVDCRG